MNTITPEVLSPEPKAEDPAPVHTQHNQQALMVRETGGAVGRALSMEELKANLRFVHQVMQDVMTEDVDYGKVPGCGDKPGLFQPGRPKAIDDLPTDRSRFGRAGNRFPWVSSGILFSHRRKGA
jgi:hypothetical protein